MNNNFFFYLEEKENLIIKGEEELQAKIQFLLISLIEMDL